MTRPITAPTIIDLLAEKHAGDVFVPECKTGSSWSGCQRLDAWAFRKSWSKFGAVGYEVKVSRSDFDQDQKWTGYLDYCHEFSFVCPGGMVKAHELPKDVGLIWVSQNRQRLHTKRKAGYREVEPEKLTMVMAYVLMSRTRIVANMNEANDTREEESHDRLAMYRHWVEEAEKRQSLAHFVNAHIRASYCEMELRVENAERLEATAEQLRKSLSALGIEWDTEDQYGAWRVEREIDKLAGRIDPRMMSSIAGAQRQLAELEKMITEIQGRDDGET